MGSAGVLGGIVLAPGCTKAQRSGLIGSGRPALPEFLCRWSDSLYMCLQAGAARPCYAVSVLCCAESQSLLTKQMRRVSRLCGPAYQGSICMHCGRSVPAQARARSPSSASGTPPRGGLLTTAAGRASPQRHGAAAPGLDSMMLATSPSLPDALHEGASGGGSPHTRPGFTPGVDTHLLTGHQGAILNLVHDCDGLLYSSSSDKTIKVPPRSPRVLLRRDFVDLAVTCTHIQIRDLYDEGTGAGAAGTRSSACIHRHVLCSCAAARGGGMPGTVQGCCSARCVLCRFGI